MPAARLTHFLCLPLVTQHSKIQLQSTLQQFAAAVTSTYDVPPKAIRPVGTIHLTLGVMQLADEQQIEAASKFLCSLDLVEMLRIAMPQPQPVNLEAAKPSTTPLIEIAPSKTANVETPMEKDTPFGAGEPAVSTPPLMVSMSGLESMHTPSKTSILYTCPTDPTSRIFAFATLLRDTFTSANLLVPDKRPLLLHATIVNTLYAKTKGRATGTGHGKLNRGIGKLDATVLLEEFQDFQWAKEFRVEKVSICRMGAEKKIVDGVVVNEEYVEIASVPLP